MHLFGRHQTNPLVIDSCFRGYINETSLSVFFFERANWIEIFAYLNFRPIPPNWSILEIDLQPARWVFDAHHFFLLKLEIVIWLHV